MQRHCLFLALLVGFFAFGTYAQSWNLAGNSNATSSSILGTTNSVPLRLFTNNAVRAYIAGNGNFGIGTASPQQRLHVEGSSLLNIFVSTSPLSNISGSGQVGYTKFLPTAAGQRLGYFLVGSRGGAENNYNSAGMVGYAEDAWSGSYHPTYLTFETSGPNPYDRIERMRITSLGSVGIGVTNPQATLDIQRGYADRAVKIVSGASGGGNDPTIGHTALSIKSDGDMDAVGIDINSGGIGINSVGFDAGVYGEGNYYGLSGKAHYSGTGVIGEGVIGVQGNGVSDNNSNTIGVYGTGTTGISGLGTTGVYGKGVIGSYGQGDTGVYALGNIYGVRGIVNTNSGNGVYGTSHNGVLGEGTGNGQGVWGNASAANGWGVRGYSALSFGVYGQTGSSTSYAGYFSGNVYTTGTYSSSDRSLKKDIADVTSAMDIIGKLKPKSYTFRNDGDYKAMMLPTGKHYGLIAQEVEDVLPELVKQTEFDAGKADPENKQSITSKIVSFKALNYTELIPILVKGMQEQQKHIEEKDNKINQLEARLAKLEALLLKENNSTSVSTAYLDNAVPNPSKGSTLIRYGLPEGITSARFTLINAKGQMLKEMSLGSRGTGQINLNTISLPAGVYTYTLVIDGQPATSKQLVIAR